MYIPDVIKSEILAGVPTPIPILYLQSVLLLNHKVMTRFGRCNIPCPLKKLLCFFQLNMFRE